MDITTYTAHSREYKRPFSLRLLPNTTLNDTLRLTTEQARGVLQVMGGKGRGTAILCCAVAMFLSILRLNPAHLIAKPC
jgi:hypothetical protein